MLHMPILQVGCRWSRRLPPQPFECSLFAHACSFAQCLSCYFTSLGLRYSQSSTQFFVSSSRNWRSSSFCIRLLLTRSCLHPVSVPGLSFLLLMAFDACSKSVPAPSVPGPARFLLLCSSSLQQSRCARWVRYVPLLTRLWESSALLFDTDMWDGFLPAA